MIINWEVFRSRLSRKDKFSGLSRGAGCKDKAAVHSCTDYYPCIAECCSPAW
jgi:hypothetical protein